MSKATKKVAKKKTVKKVAKKREQRDAEEFYYLLTRRTEEELFVKNDCGAIEEAFDNLRKDGFFAEQNCSVDNCGGNARTPNDKPYVFYHYQDLMELIDTGSCNLSFGSKLATLSDADWNLIKRVPDQAAQIKLIDDFFKEFSTKEALEAGNKIVKALKKENINVNWNGKIGTKININI